MSAVASPVLAAGTGTAAVSGSTVVFKAAPDRANVVRITRSGRTVTIDDRVTVKAGKGCKAVKGDKSKVRCTTSVNPTRVTATLGNGNDIFVNATAIGSSAYGGPGHDRISGGAGRDTVSYATRTTSVRITTTSTEADDGQNGERDTVGADVEDLNGSPQADVLTGNSATNHISGGYGDDVISGGAGNDTLAGDDGADQVHGAGGDDTLTGGQDVRAEAADAVDGGGNATSFGDLCAATSTDTVVNCERSAA